MIYAQPSADGEGETAGTEQTKEAPEAITSYGGYDVSGMAR